MKKLTALLMGIMMVLGLTACSSAPSSSSSTAESSQVSETANTSSVSESRSGVGKTLVVYYSATGNTQQAADLIAEATGADIFELEPADPYTDEDLNWTEEDSRVVREHDNPDARDVELVADTVENWDSYDTVFIGYPIWWGIAAWPVDGFIEANDFTGKTVIPFCTSSSSDLGDSGNLLEEAAGTGNWLEGQRFSSSVSQEEVQTWVEGLGL
ncbi:MAG TPA: flavodoxin [Firmicutes bacterium]|nr:flavodoxin [Bacillota bacterium]